MKQSADVIDLYEMHLFAAAVATNVRFGGSLSQALGNLVSYLRKRAAIERELRANTAQIRASAWVLGLLPMLVGGTIVLQNQEYARWFIDTKTGLHMLIYCIIFPDHRRNPDARNRADEILTMMIGPTILLAIAAVTPAGVLALEWSHRRGTLARLGSILGDPAAGANPHRPGLLQQLGSNIPGASDNGLKTAVMRAGYFHPAALPLIVALRALITAAVAILVLVQAKSGITAQTVLTALFGAFFSSRLFILFSTRRRRRVSARSSARCRRSSTCCLWCSTAGSA